MELNAKVSNFLGFEELSDEEKKEVEKIRKEMDTGKLRIFDEVFSYCE